VIRECFNYCGITLLSLSRKFYAKVLERKFRKLIKPKIQDEQCGFRPGYCTADQKFTIRRICEKKVYMAFVDLEKAYDRLLCGLFWWVLQKYVFDG
jgi:hypothetical protein